MKHACCSFASCSRTRAIDARRRMAGIEAADAAGEIKKHVAIDVDQTRAFGTFEEDAVLRLGHAAATKRRRSSTSARLRGPGRAVRMRIASRRSSAVTFSTPHHFRSEYGNQ